MTVLDRFSGNITGDDGEKKDDKDDDKSKDDGDKGGDEKKGNPTIFPADNPNVEQDCGKLHDAMHGRGTDEKAIIELLPDRSNAQRQEIKKKYKDKYVKDLDDELKSELSGDFKELVMALMADPGDFDVQELNQAMSGFGTNEDTLVGILTTRSKSELDSIKEKYKAAHKKSLEDVIKKKNSGDFRDILLELCKGQKPSDDKVDQEKAEEDAKKLHKCGETIKPSNDTLKSLMTKNNDSQINATFEEYKKESGNDLHDVIEKSCKGDVKDLYLTLAKGSGDPSTMFAERLKESFKGMGTDDDKLMRICVTRSEIDLADIKNKYKELYGKELKTEIKSETSGDYRDLLLAIIGEREKPKSSAKQKSAKKVQIKEEEKKEDKKTDDKKAPLKPVSARNQSSERGRRDSAAKDKNAEAKGKENNKTDSNDKREKSRERTKSGKSKNNEQGDDKRQKSRERSKSAQSKDPLMFQSQPPPHRDPTYEKKASPRRENSMYKSQSENSKEEEPIKKEKSKDVKKDKEDEKDKKDDKKEEKNHEKEETKKDEKSEEKTKDEEEEKKDDDSNEDWDRLYKAMKGLGTDEKTVIDVIAKNNNSQRQNVREKYQEKYKQNCIDDLKSDLSGDFRNLAVGLMLDPVEYDAHCLHEAVSGKGKKEETMIDVLLTKSPDEIEKIKEKYKEDHKKDLASDVKKKTKGDFCDVLTKVVNGSKPDDKVDDDQAEKDAKKIYKDKKNLINVKDKTFREVLMNNNPEQQKKVFEKYNELSGVPIEEAVDSSYKGDQQLLYQTLMNSNKDPQAHYAERLNDAFQGLGTNEDVLTRTVVSRVESDLPAVNTKLEENHGKNLINEIKSETSGDYRKLLLAVIGDKIKEKDVKKKEKSSPAKEKDKPQEKSSPGPAAAAAVVAQEDKRSKSPDDKKSDNKKEEKEKKGKEKKEEKQKEDTPKKDDKKEADKEDKKDEKEDKKDDSNEDWDRLYRAMKGMGTDEDTVIDVIAKNNNSQRQNVREKYQEKYEKNSIDDLKSDLSGDFRNLAVGLMLDPVEYDAHCLHEAVSGRGKKEETMIDVLIAKSPEDIDKIKERYKKDYNKDLASDIKKKTKGEFGEIITSVVNGQKPTDDKVDEDQADKDAQKIYKDKKTILNTKDKTFREVMLKNNPKQQELVFEKYSQLSGVSIEEAVETSYKGELKEAYSALLPTNKDPQAHLAKKLDDSFKGIGTNEDRLSRIVVSKNEDDLPAINTKLEENYGKNLITEIKSETSGDYRKLLLAVIGDKIKEKDVKKKEPEKKKEEQKEKDESRPAAAAIVVKEESKPVQSDKRSKSPDDKKKDEKEKDDEKKKDEKEEKRKDSIKDKDDKKEKEDEKKEEKDDSNEDWDRLYRAMKGIGTDEATVIDVIAKNNNSQRQNVREKYQEKYKQNSIDDLKSDLSGDFKNLAVGLMLEPDEYDAHCLHEAVSGKGKKEETMVDVLLTKSPEEIDKIKDRYKKDYNKDLASDVKKKTKGEFGDIVTGVLSGVKPSDDKVNEDQAEKDAKKIYKDKKNPINTKDKTFREVVMKNSPDQRKQVFEKYTELSGVGIEEAINSSYKNELKDAYLSLLNFNQDKQACYADKLNDSFQGMGTNEDRLSRVVVSRVEDDLPAINTKLEEDHGKNLIQEIKSETSGDYRKLLLAVIGDKVPERDAKKKEKPPAKEDDKPTGRSSPGPAAAAVVTKKDERSKSPDDTKSKDDKEEKGKEQEKEEKKDAKKEEEKKDDSNEDWDRLYRAMKGFGTDEDTVIDVIAKNNNSQRQNVRDKYQEKYKQNSVDDLKSELSGDFKNLAVGLMLEPEEYDAHCLHEAVSGKGRKEEMMAAVILTKSPEDLDKIKERYKKDYNKDLTADIKKKTKGEFNDIIMSALNGQKPSDNKTNNDQAEKDAKKIYKDKKNLINTKDKTFREVLLKNNPEQKKLVFAKYKELSGVEIEEGVESSYKGEMRDTYMTLLNHNEDPQVHYADQLNDCFEGRGTNEDLLSRIIVSKVEDDLPAINTKLEDNHGKNLIKEIKNETSGDYRKLLLAVIGDKVPERDAKKKEKPPAKEDKPQGRSSPGPAAAAVVAAKDERSKSPDDKKPKDSEDEKGKAEKQKDDKKEPEDKKDDKKEEEKKDDSNEDWDKLYRAMKGLGTDEDTVIHVIAKNNNSQRQNVREKYQEKYKQNSIDDLNSELSGDFKNLAVGLMLEPEEYDAHCLHEAVSGKGRKEEMMAAVILTKSPEDIEKIKEKYKKDYNKDLTADIKKKTKGEFNDIMMGVLNGQKPKDDKVNEDQAEKDAKKIYKDKKNLINTKDKTFREVMLMDNPEQRKTVFEKYKEFSDVEIEQGIEESYKGEVKDAYITLLKHNEDPKIHYANQLKECFEGRGTNEDLLTRIVVSKVENDLPAIATKHQEMHGKNLVKEIKNETSGDYQKLLLAVVKDKVEEKDNDMSSNKDDDSDEDWDKMYRAMKGLGTDEETIIDVIARNKKSQRQNIREKYKEKYKQDCMDDLKSELSGDFRKLSLGLMMNPTEYHSHCLHSALRGPGINEDAIIDIICTKSSQEISEIKKKYKEDYKKDLDSEIKKETSGDFKDLLLSILKGGRATGDSVDEMKAENAARKIYKDDKCLINPKDNTFRDVMVKDNPAQIKKVFELYNKVSGVTIYDGINRSFSSETKDAYTAMGKNIEDGENHCASSLVESVKEYGTNDDMLIRTVVSRSEDDLGDVLSRYEELTNKTMVDEVQSTAKGDSYKKLLTRIIESNISDHESKEKKFPETDCDKLYDAMKGVGTDEEVIIDVLTRRTNDERQQIKVKYKEKYKKELPAHMKSELSGDFEEIIQSLLMKPVDFDAYCLNRAIKDLNNQQAMFIGITCTRSAKDMKDIKKAYKEAYKKDLIDEVKKNSKGETNKLYVDVINTERPSGDTADDKKTEDSAKKLHQNANCNTFREVFTKNNAAQIKATFREYIKLSGTGIFTGIDNVIPDDSKEAYKSVAKVMEDPPSYYAECLYNVFSGVGTNEDFLTNIIVSRSEIDLPGISSKYSQYFERNLRDEVDDETSGDYKKTLLKLLDRFGKHQVGVENVDGTIVPSESFDASDDCEKLRDAMVGLGTDEDTVISILSACNCEQRQKLKVKYDQKFRRVLVDKLESETSGRFRDTISSLMMEPVDCDAWTMNYAVKGIGTDEGLLIYFITSKNLRDLNLVAKRYNEVYNKEMAQDIAGDTSGDFGNLLLALLDDSNLDRTDDPDELAQNLFEVTKEGASPTLEEIKPLLLEQTPERAIQMFSKYENLKGLEFTECLSMWFSGNLLKLTKSIVSSLRDPIDHHVETLHHAMKGLGTKDRLLIYIIVSRSEIDLELIKLRYQEKYETSLVDDVKSDSSGDYKKLLVKIIRGNKGN